MLLISQCVSCMTRLLLGCGACPRSLARSLMTHLSSFLGQDGIIFQFKGSAIYHQKAKRTPRASQREHCRSRHTHKFSLATRYPCLNCSVGAESPSKQSYFNLERNYVLYSICDLNYYFSNHFCLSVVLFL